MTSLRRIAFVTIKWLGISLAGLTGLVMVFGVIAYTYLHKSLPQLAGEREVAGLNGPVEILRDEFGVPHIRGDSDLDIYFGLGYAHAQDRLWQMEFTRRITQGRLSELFGSFAVTPDTYLRALDLGGAAETALASLPDDTVEKLDAYAAGVNAVIAAEDRPLPPEFFILRHQPEPWSPKDSVMLVKFLALGLSGNVFSEVIRTQLIEQLSEEQLVEFMPPAPNDWALTKEFFADAGLGKAFANLPAPPLAAASNNWVISGKHTTTGKPILANDPHLGLSAPSVWYLAHLAFEETSVIGGTMPGMPAVLTGRNEYIAWGLTTTGADVQDLFIERINPENDNEYLTPDGYVAFETREEVIKVRFGADKKVTLKKSRHGPVVPTEGFLESLKIGGHALSLSWTALAPGDQTVHGGITAMTAKNWPEFREALKSYHAPMQSIVYGDVDGTIALIAPALVPKRKELNGSKGLVPAPGWGTEYEWNGYIPFDELPQYVNPEDGLLVTANDKIVDDAYPHAITLEWESDQRTRRIRTLLAQRDVHDLASNRIIQMDEVSQLALDLMPTIREALAPVKAKAGPEQDALTVLRDWDGNMGADQPGPLIYAALIREMTRATYADETGDLFRLVSRVREDFLRKVFGADATLENWCVDVSSDTPADCQDIIRSSFSNAIAWITSRYGPKVSTWKWGRAHMAMHVHRPFGSVPVLKRFFNMTHPSGGSAATINRGGLSGSDAAPFANVHASGYRGVYDFADLNASIFMQSTGQSGNVLSPHYRDLTALWASGDYMRMTTDFAEIERNDPHRLRLTPGKSQRVSAQNSGALP